MKKENEVPYYEFEDDEAIEKILEEVDIVLSRMIVDSVLKYLESNSKDPIIHVVDFISQETENIYSVEVEKEDISDTLGIYLEYIQEFYLLYNEDEDLDRLQRISKQIKLLKIPSIVQSLNDAKDEDRGE